MHNSVHGASHKGISGFDVAANLLNFEAKQELRCKAWGGQLVLTPFICGSTWCVVDKAWISNKVAFKKKVLHFLGSTEGVRLYICGSKMLKLIINVKNKRSIMK